MSPAVRDRCEQMFMKLRRLIWTIVWDVANADRWRLEHEEVFAELSAELVQAVARYHAKPDNELKAIVLQCIRNRAVDLIAMSYHTHRKAEVDMGSLADCDDEIRVGEALTHRDDNWDREAFLKELSPDARTIVLETLNPSPRLQFFIGVAEQRKRTANTAGTWILTITPLIMQRALGWDRQRLDTAWNEVSQVFDSQ